MDVGVLGNKAVREEMGRILKGFQAVLVGSDSLEELRRRAGSWRPQVVIVDLDSQGIDLSTFSRLEAWAGPAAVVALSRRPFHPELREAFEKHIRVCLRKPVDRDELWLWLRAFGRCDRLEEEEGS
ncbi:CheY chemotaxis protein or a CheY-like REC (receiver) domain [Desulfacinum infernum DSM 9756]|uniref:CheY chemotaxis protein or a CheY-like REC (Receiver) domain n=1 Tax=Desulfacinum infernum DSM 9756 TaxID=1121391 RepID=A0A1M4TYZ8_9BACT|nr:response regulator [Desulfacinum infernum]SHE49705.1 CheY chemotaxis protein or a CheY-like REC (receiver) domain [Desulfacinum infernum DSM 9756]